MFPKSYWHSRENRRKLWEDIKQRCNIIEPSEWGKVSVMRIYSYGGLYLLKKYFKGSIYDCLKSVFPGKYTFCSHSSRNRMEERMVF